MLIYCHTTWAAGPFLNDEGTAINGYDPVAYFTEKSSVRGEEEHQLTWAGTTWLFSSAENLAIFSADPEQYAPQYGGYCAYAMAEGAVVTSDPRAWSIIDDKLYLNISRDTRRLWRKTARRRLIPEADQHWQRLIGD